MTKKLPWYAAYNNSLGLDRFCLAVMSWQMLLVQPDHLLVVGNIWIFMELLNQPDN